MKSKSMIEAWKNAENEMNEKNPVIVYKEMMNQITGGGNSAGWVCTISGECNSSGKSCNPFDWFKNVDHAE